LPRFTGISDCRGRKAAPLSVLPVYAGDVPGLLKIMIVRVFNFPDIEIVGYLAFFPEIMIVRSMSLIFLKLRLPVTWLSIY
jgi:hypothetical protein